MKIYVPWSIVEQEFGPWKWNLGNWKELWETRGWLCFSWYFSTKEWRFVLSKFVWWSFEEKIVWWSRGPFAYILYLSRRILAIITCQWFFTALSVRPGKCLAITAHLLPWIRWEVIRRSSSSSVKGFLFILGSNWLNHLSLQLFPNKIHDKMSLCYN